MFELIKAPWTKEQVKTLKVYQENRSVHPYTCVCSGSSILIPTKKGWICKNCDYKQDSFYEYSLEAAYLRHWPFE